jgi:hypothetical protein
MKVKMFLMCLIFLSVAALAFAFIPSSITLTSGGYLCEAYVGDAPLYFISGSSVELMTPKGDTIDTGTISYYSSSGSPTASVSWRKNPSSIWNIKSSSSFRDSFGRDYVHK